MSKTTRCTRKKNSASPQLATCDVGGDNPMLLLKRDGNPHGKQPLFSEEDLIEFCFDIIGDLDANDDKYDSDIKHLISYPNNNKRKQAYLNHEDQFKAFCKSCNCNGFNKPKYMCNLLDQYVKKQC
eukprot:12138861-Ditylum_brightwellii.AAC.1